MVRHVATSSKVTTQLDALTALRGMAAWMVVLFHLRGYLQTELPVWSVQLLSKGYLAVDLFFCLSGFVIYLNYRHSVGGSWASYRSFLYKRLARVYPLHLITLMGYVVLLILLLTMSTRREVPDYMNGTTFVLNLFLVQNWGFTSFLSWNIPAWSISVEFLAYLLFPLMLLIGKPQTKSNTGLFWSVCLTVFLLGTLAMTFQLENLGQRIEQFGAIRCVLQFYLGCLAAEWLLRQQALPHKLTLSAVHALLLSVLVVVAGRVLALHEAWVIPLFWFLMVSGVSRLSGWPRVCLCWPPLVYLGSISYSTYLLHDLILEFAKILLLGKYGLSSFEFALLVLVVILLCSIVSYRLIEIPLQKWVISRIDTGFFHSLLAKSKRNILPTHHVRKGRPDER